MATLSRDLNTKPFLPEYIMPRDNRVVRLYSVDSSALF